MAGTKILPRPSQGAPAAGPIPAVGYAAFSPDSPLVPWEFERRPCGPRDVVIEILYCGICHTDIHMVRNEWGIALYPMVPGHEIVGTVTSVGSEVTKWKAGDSAGIGCFVDSDRECAACRDGDEQYCEKGPVLTYSSRERDGQTVTQGGYSTVIVVNEDYVYRLPKILPLDRTAPLLCAGITTYSPLKRAGFREGDEVAIAGLGGLGHMGVKFARAMGANVTVLSTSPGKREDALQLGADEFIATRDPDVFMRNANRFHFILDTIAAKHDIGTYARLLRRNGRLVQVGAPPEPLPLAVFDIIQNRRSIGGSMIGGLKETQEMLDFCGQNGIAAEVEVIRIHQVGDAYERMLKNDVKYRFVIDIGSLKEERE